VRWLKALWLGLTHNTDGSFSSTKFWQTVGYICATYIVVALTLSGKMTAEILLIYVGAVTAARSFQNYLTARGQQQQGYSSYLGVGYGGGYRRATNDIPKPVGDDRDYR